MSDHPSGPDHAEAPAGRRRIGIDVGGTKCLAVVCDDRGRVLEEARRPTPSEPDELLARLCELAHLLGPAESVGVGVPGLVTREGVLRAAPHITSVADLPLRELLAGRLDAAVFVDNDATCALLAEVTSGAARGARDAVLVTLGTGIGGGVLAGGAIQRGANGFAGELGHMVVDPDGPACPCGRRGCWERFASGTALAAAGQAGARAGRLPRVLELAGGDVDAVRGEHVTAVAREGDGPALAVLDEFGRWVAIGVVNLTNMLDPALFVLGGGLVELEEVVVAPVQAWLGELLYVPSLRPHPRLVTAALGERVGAIGAAALATEGRPPEG